MVASVSYKEKEASDIPFQCFKRFYELWKIALDPHTRTYADMQYHWSISPDISLLHFHIGSMVKSLNFLTPSI